MASDEKRWARPTAKEGQAEVWKYFDLELPDKDRVKCTKCPAQYYKYSGSTTIMWKHLAKEHQITKETTIRQPRQQESSPTEKSSTSAAPSDAAPSTSATPAETSDMSSQPALKQMSVLDSFAR